MFHCAWTFVSKITTQFSLWIWKCNVINVFVTSDATVLFVLIIYFTYPTLHVASYVAYEHRIFWLSFSRQSWREIKIIFIFPNWLIKSSTLSWNWKKSISCLTSAQVIKSTAGLGLITLCYSKFCLPLYGNQRAWVPQSMLRFCYYNTIRKRFSSARFRRGTFFNNRLT